MKLKYNASRLWVGGWLLVGLSVAGLNGYQLLSLLDEPLAGYSEDVRRVDRGLNTTRNLFAAETKKIGSGMDGLTERFTPVQLPLPVSRKNRPVSIGNKKVFVPIPLPTLAGVITRRSSDGAIQKYAMLDGTVCAEGDKVGSLTVEEITIRGVRLVKGGTGWFLKAPDNAYSLTAQ